MANVSEISSQFDIIKGLSIARGLNQYTPAVHQITGKSLSSEEAKAFLLYLAESAFDPGDERDIVLISWSLIRGFEKIEQIKDRHKLYKALSTYGGALSGLNHKETDTLYPRIALYYQRIKDKDAFLTEAIKTKLPNRKGTVQLPELCNKKAEAPGPPAPQTDDTAVENAATVQTPKEIAAGENQKQKTAMEVERPQRVKGHKIDQQVKIIIIGVLALCVFCFLYFQIGPGKELLTKSKIEKSMGSLDEESSLASGDPANALLFQLQRDIEDLKIEATQFDELTSRAEAGDIEAAYQLGLKYYTKEDYESTYQWLLIAAEAGHSQAQAALGALCSYELSREPDMEAAFNWTMQSAEQGNPTGQNNLGYMYQTGMYVDKDPDKAFEWYQEAADQGLNVAYDNLGYCFFNGLGTTPDNVKALECFEKAYAAGFAFSANHIAFMYQNGYGIAKDIATAIKWYSIGADNDDSFALAELGKIYEKGDGVPKDLALAFDYYYRAAELGNTWAMRAVAYWYYTGKYVDKDYDETLKWLTRASEAGDEKASENLRQFYETLALLKKLR